MKFLFLLKPYGHNINNSLRHMPLLTSCKTLMSFGAWKIKEHCGLAFQELAAE